MSAIRRGIFVAFCCLSLTACAVAPSYRDQNVTIASMASFDASKYAGEWYEVARFPVFFQRGCRNTTATYVGLPDGALAVLNECETDDGLEQIGGRAEVVGPGRLTVNLDGVPFGADYWVLWVDEGYRTAVVGTPSGRAGWILNRTPNISPDRLAAARDVLSFNGYDVSQLVMTEQVAP